MKRGRLRIYLGASPGVGKTYAMLDEAHRRAERGTDVVLALVETHGRLATAALVDGLEQVPRRRLTYRGIQMEEMDLDAVLARSPAVAVVDELAHTNVPGLRHGKRWEDVRELLDAGITVLSTLNIQHLESLNDVVAQITGVHQRETIPDSVVRAADEVELVDMAPEALRQRISHGNVYAADKVGVALDNFFRVGNLTALRELALLWVAGRVDEQLGAYRAEHGISDTWEARERVVVALTGGPEGEALIRRAVRVAERSRGADLMAVHITRSDGLTGTDPTLLTTQRLLIESLGGTFHHVVGDDVPGALLDFARGVNATQLVLGASRRGRFAQAFSRGVGVATVSRSGPIDVHLVTHEGAGAGRVPAAVGNLSRWRRSIGFAMTVLILPLVGLLADSAELGGNLTTGVLLILASVVGIALVGGIGPALLAAPVGFLVLNYFFTTPRASLVVGRPQDLIDLVVFVWVAVAVAVVVDRSARRTREAAAASADAQALADITGRMVTSRDPLGALLEHLRETFDLKAVSLFEHAAGGPDEEDRGARASEDWVLIADVGDSSCQTQDEGHAQIPIDAHLMLVLGGRSLPAGARRILEAYGAQVGVALRQRRLAAQAETAAALSQTDRMRTALLATVSHDLRTPIAAAKAAVTSLRSTEVQFDERDRRELLTDADEALDLLTRLISHLLDMSRLQTGSLGINPVPVDLADAAWAATAEIGPAAGSVEIRIEGGGAADDLSGSADERDPHAGSPPAPEIEADPALLQRVLVNLIQNAIQHSPADRPPHVMIGGSRTEAVLRVVDHGPGVDEDQREQIFLPFQRLGDTDNTTGVGLGLALSRGLTEAMGGTLHPEDTPDGGLTMRLAFRAPEPGVH